MNSKIPVSVIIVTRNEAPNLPRCLAALAEFDEVIVVDSQSTDGSARAAQVQFVWNGTYPKKRQWCLDNVKTRHDRIFFVDADEEITPELTAEIRAIDWRYAGYFVRGRYVYEGRALRFGLKNNKLALFDRRRFAFPVVDDLDAPGMGEIEGHYQPLPKDKATRVGQLRAELLHHATDGGTPWQARHKNYAAWEAWMLRHNAYPPEIGWRRSISKYLFRHLPARPAMAFVHSYIIRGGFIDGQRGLRFACSRFRYYRMVNDALSVSSKGPGPQRAESINRIAA